MHIITIYRQANGKQKEPNIKRSISMKKQCQQPAKRIPAHTTQHKETIYGTLYSSNTSNDSRIHKHNYVICKQQANG